MPSVASHFELHAGRITRGRSEHRLPLKRRRASQSQHMLLEGVAMNRLTMRRRARQSVAIEVLQRSLLLQSAEQSKRLLLEKVVRRVLRRGLLLQSAVTSVLR